MKGSSHMRTAGIVMGATLVLILLVFSPGYGQEPMLGILKAADKEMAPDFSLKDLYGRSVNFKNSYAGRNVLLVFTTTWCPSCQREVAELKKIHANYKGRLDIVAIYINESPRKVFGFVREYQIPYTVLLDSSGEVASSYDVFLVPNKVLVGKDGAIKCWMCQSMDKYLERLLAAQKK